MPVSSFRSILTAIAFVSASLSSSAMAAPASQPGPGHDAQDIGICAAPTSWAGTDKVLTCTCPANFDISTSLWGTDIYTADSYICSTALHASVLDRSGGRVTIEMLPGQNSYTGSKRHGVSTRSYGKYRASYRFVDAVEVNSSGASASGRNRANGNGRKSRSGSSFERDAAAILGSLGLGNLGQVENQLTGEDIGECRAASKWRGTGKALSCSCPANISNTGSVWGTDIYTDDSYICKAALHAGRIDRSGGQVSIQMLPGQSSYAGTRRNGVTTMSYRSYAGSYRFN